MLEIAPLVAYAAGWYSSDQSSGAISQLTAV